mgnify:FL=1
METIIKNLENMENVIRKIMYENGVGGDKSLDGCVFVFGSSATVVLVSLLVLLTPKWFGILVLFWFIFKVLYNYSKFVEKFSKESKKEVD